MSSSLDSDVFLSNDEEYLNRLARPGTRAQLNSNQSNNNDDESDQENNNQGQDSVLSQVNLQPHSEGGANPKKRRCSGNQLWQRTGRNHLYSRGR